jgi:hypothetical protein
MRGVLMKQSRRTDERIADVTCFVMTDIPEGASSDEGACSFKRCSGEARFEFKYSAQVGRGRGPAVCRQKHTVSRRSSRCQML